MIAWTDGCDPRVDFVSTSLAFEQLSKARVVDQACQFAAPRSERAEYVNIASLKQHEIDDGPWRLPQSLQSPSALPISITISNQMRRLWLLSYISPNKA